MTNEELIAEAQRTQGYSEGDLRSLVRSLSDALTAAHRGLAAGKAAAWDEGHRACDRDWEFTGDLSTPDEDRVPMTNPYGETSE